MEIAENKEFPKEPVFDLRGNAGIELAFKLGVAAIAFVSAFFLIAYTLNEYVFSHGHRIFVPNAIDKISNESLPLPLLRYSQSSQTIK